MRKRFLITLLAALTITTAALPAMTVLAETVAENGEVTEQTNAMLSADTISIGGTVTVTAAAEPVEGSLYAVYYRAQGASAWVRAKDYSEETEAVLTPKKVGVYEVLVKTKDAAGRVTREQLSFKVEDDLSLAAELSKETVYSAEGVTVTAFAEGGNSGYTYTVYWKPKAKDSWYTAQKAQDTCDVKINPVKAGEYDVCVKVADETGRMKKQNLSFTVVDFDIEAGLQLEEVTLGQKQTITASLQEYAGDCEYAFYFRKQGESNWKGIQSYSDKNTCRFLPKETGVYEVCVKAKNAIGAVRKKYPAFTVNEAPSVTQVLSANVVELEEAITVTPEITGGTGDVHFAVYYTTKEAYDAGNPKWTTAFNYDEDGEAVFKFNEEGEYVVVTKAKDANGKVAKSAYQTVTVTESAEPLKVSGSFKGERKVYGDRAAKFTAAAEGGVPAYTYAFKVKDVTDEEWKDICDFEAAATVELTYTNVGPVKKMDNNNYELMVIVKDARGKTAQEIYSFTVTGYDEYELPIIFR